ncbi:MAG: cobalamin biosynthesis protein [Rhodocyclaceae bacterium]|nr:cobalamin biosynthesis protein [Rhodocyclaceae bacterium]
MPRIIARRHAPSAAIPMLADTPFLFVFMALLGGVALDRIFGEARCWHPLVGFGRFASALEARLNGSQAIGARELQLRGLLAWLLAVLAWVVAASLLRSIGPVIGWLVDVSLLYLALGGRSLAEHAEAVAAPLASGDLAEARRRVGWMVSRDTAQLDERGVARAGVESVLENGNDAVFGALFWFLIAGGPGALLFRLANTLDAMWGYRNQRFLDFGRAAARIDDLLNWAPARLTALSYALLGATSRSLACWRAQAPAWDSPNAGAVMAAGAGALDVQLGGSAVYHGRLEARPPLGAGMPPDAGTIRRAIRLVAHATRLWLGVAALVALASVLSHA